MKTVEELTAELKTLEAAQRENSLVASSLAACQQRVAAVTAQVVLGSVGKSELVAAEAALTACVEAIGKKPFLDQAVSDQQKLIEEARHRARSDLITGLKADFQTEFTEYVLSSKALYQQFRRLKSLDNRYRALAGSGFDVGLLGPEHADLHLPAVHGALGQRCNIPSGREP